MVEILQAIKIFNNVTFQDEGHKYFYKGKLIQDSISTTSLIHSYVPEFDKSRFSQEQLDEWLEENKFSQIKGTQIHLYVQNQWKCIKYEFPFDRFPERFRERLKVELVILKKQADNFYEDYKDMLEIIQDELLIYDNDYNVFGAIDLLFRNKYTGGIILVDIKSNKELKDYTYINKSNGNKVYQQMLVPLQDLTNCNLNEYYLQVGIYEFIFEKYTLLKIEDKFILHLDITKYNYTIIEPLNVKKEAIKILEMRRRISMKNSLPILLLGNSGSGKSASLRNFTEAELGIINVLGKELPFKNNFKTVVTDDYETILNKLLKTDKKTIVIDDAGYLIVNQFMRNHSKGGGGNAVFAVYNDLADNFWGLINNIKKIPGGKTIYLNMHIDSNDMGFEKPKTIGKLLDDKVCIEGLFTIVLKSICKDGKYLIRTKNNGNDVVKTPIGMFEEEEYDNDLKVLDKVIREYYELDKIEDKKEEENK